LITVEEEPPLPSMENEIITVRGRGVALYTVPEDRDFLLTDFCANGANMFLSLGGPGSYPPLRVSATPSPPVSWWLEARA
jgi:hypothetical protein